MRYYGAIVGIGLLLTSCASQPSQQERAAAEHPKIQSFAGAPTGPSNPASNRVKMNLPSAAVTTPLCGTALHEQAATGGAIYTSSLGTGNSCTRNACFQPLTGTFIAENGTNSVCR
ncbi:hypothetical protein [Bombella sp. ESL0385]|uniref:hypothetical protein n=1 Tax=Bombella sp. ESL0385 TaxID=2676446 RepID=UPI0012DA00D3|nr:hypothetical protein [Bombella sp. ESL0385]MUG89844.1 hypothetical protein [Bombella sp. ESL0385]